MQVIKHIMVQRNYDEKLKYDEHLRKVEEIKFNMADRYRLHPNNFITKKNGDDIARDCDLPFYLCGHRKTLVEWDERRIDTIGSNGNEGFHYGEI